MKIYTYDNKIMTVGGKWMEQPAQPGPGPGPSLPPYTIRLKFTEGVTPTFSKGTAVQVSSSPNIWDLTYENTDWNNLLYGQTDLLEVIGANTTGVTDMNGLFHGCRSLTSIPLFNTSNVTAMNVMFYNCYNVQSGALALYRQASSQATIPEHSMTFRDCGIDTTTGRAELAQIPSDWK